MKRSKQKDKLNHRLHTAKIKLANLCWKTSNVKLVTNNKHSNLQHGRFLSVVALTGVQQ